MAEKPLIFLSYASPDRDRVLPFYDALDRKGLDVWMDTRRLVAGQNWDFEIKRALSKAVLVVIFITKNSVDRRGYVQRELKEALDKRKEKLIDDIYLIPVVLDEDAKMPDELTEIQFVRGSDRNCFDQIYEAISIQLRKLGEAISETQSRTNITWTDDIYRESWDGAPGYDCEFLLPKFSSSEFPLVGQITDIIKGHMLGQLMAQRETKLDGQSDFLSFGDPKYRRTNSWEAYCGEPHIVNRVMSLSYAVHWYGAGAAHPNMHFDTFCFLLDPLIQVAGLEEVFEDKDKALALLQGEVRRLLLEDRAEGADESDTLDKDWVERGTAEWDDFGAFVFTELGIDIFFSPYHVAAYAFGPQVVSVPFKPLVPLMRKVWASALGVSHLAVDDPPWAATN